MFNRSVKTVRTSNRSGFIFFRRRQPDVVVEREGGRRRCRSRIQDRSSSFQVVFRRSAWSTRRTQTQTSASECRARECLPKKRPSPALTAAAAAAVPSADPPPGCPIKAGRAVPPHRQRQMSRTALLLLAVGLVAVYAGPFHRGGFVSAFTWVLLRRLIWMRFWFCGTILGHLG